jgi:hypothetical protein
VRFRYVPVLRWKRGEKVGLRNVSEEGRQDVVPLFVVASDRYVGKKATQSSPVGVAAADLFAQEMLDILGATLFFLDASTLPRGANGQHPIIDIGASARVRGLSLIPTTRLDASILYQQTVRSIVDIDGRGVGLRVDLQGMTSAASWVGAWPFALQDTDLLVDFADNVGTVAALGDSINSAFANLYQAGNWRTVTVIGSSMPENFTGYQAGLYTIPRSELLLWQQLANANLSYRIDYGDYATVPTIPAPVGIAWGFPINAKYTIDADFLICRGVNTTGLGGVDMDEQLMQHANSIVQFAQRGPLAQCWADARIDRIAARTTPPGNLEAWVQIGVNRHVELTRLRLP